MRIGIMFGARREVLSVEVLIERVQQIEHDGFSSFWVPHLSSLGFDALTALALVGYHTSRIELGTAVVPVYPFHPTALAQHALTAQVASKGRLALGIGLSHKPVVENSWGLSYNSPARYMQEYLQVLRPLISENQVDFAGEVFTVKAEINVQGATPCPVLIAGLAPRMLRHADELSDGTITWMAGAKTIETHIAPMLNEAAAGVGRPQPRICVALPIAVTDDAPNGREQANKDFHRYGQLVNYRRMLDIESSAGPEDVAVVGNEDEVETQLRTFATAGTTDFLASVFPVGNDMVASEARTLALLKCLNGNI